MDHEAPKSSRPRSSGRLPVASTIAAIFLGFLLGSVAIAPLSPLPDWPVATVRAEERPHAPILIDDAALCAGASDAVTNCDTANGSLASPYRIDGWTVRLGPTDAGVSCPGGPPAAIAVCGTTKHLILSNLTIVITQGPDPAVGIDLAHRAPLRIEESALLVSGTGVRAHASTPGSGRLLLDGVRLGPPPLPAIAAPDAVLVAAVNVPVTVRDSDLDGSGREAGMTVRADDGVEAPLLIENSSFHDTPGTALRVDAVPAALLGNAFVGNGLPHSSAAMRRQDPVIGNGSFSVVLTPVIHLRLSDAEWRIVGNEVQAVSTGIWIEGNASGTLRLNQFYRGLSVSAATSGHAVLLAEDACQTRVTYNAFRDGLALVHNAFRCEMDATYNWWGGEGGPSDGADGTGQASGPMKVSPWLRVDLDRLPTVRIRSPVNGDPHWGELHLRGDASGHASNPLDRVELSDRAHDWSRPVTAQGTGAWTLRLDLDAFPEGPLRLWVRACGVLECGIPAPFDLIRIADPVVPVAVLHVDPRVVTVGGTITADASRSYSPTGHAIVAWRFRVGHTAGDWSQEPTFTTTLADPGAYLVGVDVQDARGLVNANPGEVTVRVLDRAAPLDEGRLPAPDAVTVLLVLGLGMAWARRRP